MAELERLQRNWTALGEQDPLWAILSDPAKRGRAWDEDLDEFFASGRANVDYVLQALADRGVAIERGRALDFGCGVGRLTRALGEHFAQCDGVDVASSMIERARELNKSAERVRFHHNPAPDLRLFSDGSFDFVLALIVLQHMEPELMRSYIREFVRVLRPGGVAFFNIPERFVLGEALPPEARRASLTLVEPVPPVVAGQVAPLRVRVRNDSPVCWPTTALVQVGDHWRTSDGRLVAFDDARTVIGTAVEPGADCELQLGVLAPAQPGDYELEIDLLQELIGWFADRGSDTLKLPVTVVPGPDGPAHGGGPDEGRQTTQSELAGFEMHVMVRDDVVFTVEDAGGVVLDMLGTDWCGPLTPSLDYVVARAVGPPRVISRETPRDAPGTIGARIRVALEDSVRASSPARELLSADPLRPDRNRAALSTMEGRADLVGFDLTTRLNRLGRASTALRGGLRRALFQVLHRQTEFNRTAIELIRSHEVQLEALGATVRAQLDIQASAEERLDAVDSRLGGVEAGSVRRAGRAARAGLTYLDWLSFAEHFRGSPDDLRERQRTYVPRFAECSGIVDAGCGRGEFLELLREAGIAAVGVDSDEAMVSRCRSLGLDAVHDDAVDFLRGRDELSLGGIFAGHLIEHLEREETVELVRLAFTRLRPRGVLLLDTVNPLCLSTYGRFYSDFTNVAPVPPQALQWLAESCGFESVEIEYASPVPPERKMRPLPASAGEEADVEAFNRGLAAANELLFGFQEYALIARKPG